MGCDWNLQGVTICTGGTDQRELLHNVNMTFQAGKITLLIGHNGAGKSTLLETIAGIRSIQKGSIELGMDPLWLQHRRKSKLNLDVTLKLGISMQQSESQWFASTVREEMLYSLKPYRIPMIEAEKRMEEALTKVGLPGDILMRDPWTLSGGQQRRLSLACLLACEPEWLLLDEPTAGLDATGIHDLCTVLEEHRAQGRGVIVATHDLNALLPLADAVVVVNQGIIHEVHDIEEIAQDAAVPRVLSELAKYDLLDQLESNNQEDTTWDGCNPWPDPKEVAVALAAKLSRMSQTIESSQTEVHELIPSNPFGIQPKSSKIKSTHAVPDNDEHQPNHYFDPRALVMMYLLLSAAVFAQRNFIQLSIAAVVIIALLMPFRALITPWIKVIRAYIILIFIFGLFTGISIQPLAMDWDRTIPTALRLCKLLLIMLLGMPMLGLMTPLRLQRAIEQSFGWLSRLKIPIYSFSLVVTLIFRFIPLLTGEWQRFAKLAHARGKVVTPLQSVPISMIQSTIIPYVRSILRLAEQMADALEVRGFGYIKEQPTFGFRLHFDRFDWVLISIASICGLFLFILPVYL
ncbi:ATP-binding cassette domain-containing protein [Paenibacillus sp. CMAA1364]